MSEKNATVNRKYFAASNSFTGFTSYFDKIFNPSDFSHLYILKGGPGTGKSSFMKRVRDHFAHLHLDVEEIYCSSDPKSLDGIIIGNENDKIAIIDGTAPHEQGTALPGAVDDIINLGQNWDSHWLISGRDKILALNAEKKKAYSAAYKYLGIGKAAFEYIKDTHLKHFDYGSASNYALSFLKDEKTADFTKEKIRLISAFSKEGYTTLDTLDEISEECININGSELDTFLLLDTLRHSAKLNGIPIQLSPSPLCGYFCDAVYFPESKRCIKIAREKDGNLNSASFTRGIPDSEKESIKKAHELLEEAKQEAVRWFNIASDFHFRLEDIYSAAMIFEENEKSIIKTIEDIEILFDKDK